LEARDDRAALQLIFWRVAALHNFRLAARASAQVVAHRSFQPAAQALAVDQLDPVIGPEVLARAIDPTLVNPEDRISVSLEGQTQAGPARRVTTFNRTAPKD
jgi:hypothetical protein